ncbi:MAG: ATP-binding cassette domain-containing protein, partial [Bryobacteraceae bacterium]|nr:ATP-binding cassette domain-containing protein [Bryobacteraceae bacterium]
GGLLINGVPIERIPLARVRGWLGYVPQDALLFSRSIRDNVRFGRPEATDEEVLAALAQAGFLSDLALMPDGLDTLVGERGVSLSGGQKQRTAIARAILRNPRILILDDALSSVDTETEARILSRLAGVMRERTTILISHRVSTVRNADRIFVIENGRLAEEGTHAELLALGGYYADLYQRQLLEEELEAI